jgi:hypothetical protein
LSAARECDIGRGGITERDHRARMGIDDRSGSAHIYRRRDNWILHDADVETVSLQIVIDPAFEVRDFPAVSSIDK